MWQSAHHADVPPLRISLQGIDNSSISLDLTWLRHLLKPSLPLRYPAPCESAISVPLRPNRAEPRVTKRRPEQDAATSRSVPKLNGRFRRCHNPNCWVVFSKLLLWVPSYVLNAFCLNSVVNPLPFGIGICPSAVSADDVESVKCFVVINSTCLG